MDKLLKDRTIKDKDAVMFDIDDTLIFTNGRANKPIINLLHYCSHLGYSIVIITARPDRIWMHQFTKWQLKKYNIIYDELLVSFLRKHPSNFYIFTEGAHAVPTTQLLSVYNVDELEETGEYYVAGETPFKIFQKVDSLSDEDYIESSESESESMSLEDEDET